MADIIVLKCVGILNVITPILFKQSNIPISYSILDAKDNSMEATGQQDQNHLD
jgi:hypothetical protein